VITKETELRYGSDSVRFAYDEERYRVLSSAGSDESPLSDIQIAEALDSPINSPPLEEIVAPGESVLIVVSDATRATASAQVVNMLVRRLIQIGIAPGDIAIIFATGIHRSVTAAERRDLLTPFIAQRIKTIEHNAYDPTTVVSLAETAGGTPVEVNRALRDYSRVIITGAIGFHYFAGFSGGRKAICPGLASARTIEATHMLALDFEGEGRRDGVGAGLLKGNAVHEECERVAQLIDPSFSINTVVDERGRAVRVYAGHWRTAHAQGCEEYLKNHSMQIESRRDVVVASCGGFPRDINLIQAHKALDMAAHACKDGGTIVLLAECREGFGRADFLKWFAEKDSCALEARLREAYEVNGQTAWSLLTKAERFRINLISNLADDDVRQMRMVPAHSLRQALAESENGTPAYILPHGAGLLPVIKY
jgi:lactate racemase